MLPFFNINSPSVYKLKSTVVPAEEANATAQRLSHENALLCIELEQAKEEVKTIKATKFLVRKGG